MRNDLTLDEKEDLAIQDIKEFLSKSPNPVIAFSGGKDALVASHLVHRVADLPSVCETSFYYQTQKEDIQANAERQGWKVTYRDSLSQEWLQKHTHFVFSNNSKDRARSFQLRHQTTVRKEVETQDYSGAIFGRRTQENFVPSKHYKFRERDSFHPIRDWSTKDVWQYLAKHKIPTPWIYSTKAGELEGNAGFITLRAKDLGGIVNAWKLTYSLDERYQPSYLGADYENKLRSESQEWFW